MNKTLNHAKKAILTEIRMYPCLGLVSRWNQGIHQDMNYKVFKKSYYVISSMLNDIFINLNRINNFQDLKKLGYQYELLMFKKTHNINTHKGLIFCFAIFWYSYLKQENNQDYKNMQDFIINFCQELNLTNYSSLNTYGARLYLENQVKGARFIALTGYEVVFKVYDFYLKKLLNLKLNKKILNFILLLKITSLVDDTTAIKKVGLEKYREFQKETLNFIDDILINPYHKTLFKKVKDFNKAAINNNISPGGSADLLVLVFFLIYENN